MVVFVMVLLVIIFRGITGDGKGRALVAAITSGVMT